MGEVDGEDEVTERIPEFISHRPRQKAMEGAIAQLNASTPPGSEWDPAEVAKVAARAVRGSERYYRAWTDAFDDPDLLQFEEWVQNQATRIRRSRRAHEANERARIVTPADTAQATIARPTEGGFASP